MKPTVGRLLVTIALFVGWLVYLGFLVLCRPHTPDGLRGAFEGRAVTVSRPQILVSMLDVVARVDNVQGEDVLVEEVLYPKDNPPVKVGDKIKVSNIDQCQPLPDPMEITQKPPLDWTGPGSYLLPLQIEEKNGERHFKVVPTPPSPGYPPQLQSPPADYPKAGHPGPPRIYPATSEMRAEYKSIPKGE
ncbi:MAG TPA: hypothetical protein VN688_25295 [Gemmataceae bacterium]|nr:hypothetical protein [Gemmataceae bacterium]